MFFGLPLPDDTNDCDIFNLCGNQHMSARVLFIEDDPHLRRNFTMSLTLEGYEVQVAASLEQAFLLWNDANESQGIDLVLLDLGLPDGSGANFLSTIRPLNVTPVIVTSARQSEHEKARLLNMGANAFLVKPFTLPELLASIRSILAMQSNPGLGTEKLYLFDEICINLGTQCVLRAGAPVDLTATEYGVLARLVQSAGHVVTDSQLLTQVFGFGQAARKDLLRLCMAQLRSKLEVDPAEPQLLQAVPGIGYSLAAPRDMSFPAHTLPRCIPDIAQVIIKDDFTD
jgi:two-component system KDP operon response regulator KdpE